MKIKSKLRCISDIITGAHTNVMKQVLDIASQKVIFVARKILIVSILI